MSNRGSPPALPHSFLCLMKTDFSEQVEKLRKEITTAIKAVLEEYGKTEMEFPDTVDAVYVIWFDHDGDPYECLVRRIQFFGKDLHLVVEDKHSHDLYEIDGPFETRGTLHQLAGRDTPDNRQHLFRSNTKTKIKIMMKILIDRSVIFVTLENLKPLLILIILILIIL